ncbi:hypothetical protein PHMEG_0007816 [Phytophthora megakarya]|uniref:Uncharacterized protein n=1 Tax=Phytophthora megakarya TaxID=4795 RepID=A0A225WKH8_9STRA|nr:hypothetical protein PHMEG_0007816 [Phytophthora megakarya]
MWKFLADTKCKSRENIEQHVEKMMAIKAQLTDLNEDSLPKNDRLDRLKGTVATGFKNMNIPEKIKNQALKMESYHKEDRRTVKEEQVEGYH